MVFNFNFFEALWVWCLIFSHYFHSYLLPQSNSCLWFFHAWKLTLVCFIQILKFWLIEKEVKIIILLCLMDMVCKLISFFLSSLPSSPNLSRGKNERNINYFDINSNSSVNTREQYASNSFLCLVSRQSSFKANSAENVKFKPYGCKAIQSEMTSGWQRVLIMTK